MMPQRQDGGFAAHLRRRKDGPSHIYSEEAYTEQQNAQARANQPTKRWLLGLAFYGFVFLFLVFPFSSLFLLLFDIEKKLRNHKNVRAPYLKDRNRRSGVLIWRGYGQWPVDHFICFPVSLGFLPYRIIGCCADMSSPGRELSVVLIVYHPHESWELSKARLTIKVLALHLDCSLPWQFPLVTPFIRAGAAYVH